VQRKRTSMHDREKEKKKNTEKITYRNTSLGIGNYETIRQFGLV